MQFKLQEPKIVTMIASLACYSSLPLNQLIMNVCATVGGTNNLDYLLECFSLARLDQQCCPLYFTIFMMPDRRCTWWKRFLILHFLSLQ